MPENDPKLESPLQGDSPTSRRTGNRKTLAVAVVIVALLVVLAYLALSFDIIGAPYPSEETSLTEYQGGVVWTRDPQELVNGQIAVNYSELTLHIQIPDWTGYEVPPVGSAAGGSWPMSDATRMDYRLFNYTTAGPGHRTVGFDTPEGVIWETFWFVITDEDGDEVFDPGDHFAVFCGRVLNDALVEQGFREDRAYALKLVFDAGETVVGMYVFNQFAFLDGKFYTWHPDTSPFW